MVFFALKRKGQIKRSQAGSEVAERAQAAQ
jgi:hypothetical protein